MGTTISTGKLGKVSQATNALKLNGRRIQGFVWECYACTDKLAHAMRWANIYLAACDLENHHRMRH